MAGGLRPDTQSPDPELVRDQLETFSDRAMDAIPNGEVLTVDCGALPAIQVLEGASGGPIARLSESLGLRGADVSPVVRASDTGDACAKRRTPVGLISAVLACGWHQN